MDTFSRKSEPRVDRRRYRCGFGWRYSCTWRLKEIP